MSVSIFFALYPHQRGDLLLREAGHEAVGSSVHQLGKAHQQGGGFEFVGHRVDDLHLVDAALDVACLEGVALPGEGGVNGSGKHDNWSLVTNTGKNLLSPGKTPYDNKQFLLFLSAVIAAVDDNAALLRMSASNPGNDHRLGANEAPPAIISIFLGEQLEDIVEQILQNGTATHSNKGERMDIGVHTIPPIKKDATDRNRTSPFAFTGNKFEFRMVASSMSIAGANTVLNATVADVLQSMADRMEKADDLDKTVDEIIYETLKEHQKVIFNGNGYSDEWIAEAE